MNIADITDAMSKVIQEVGNPPVSKSFPNPPIALSATITIGGIEVR